MAWQKRNAPLVLFGAALLAAGALLLALGSGLTFYQDSWSFLMYRRELTVGAFLQPHNEHIVAIPVAIQKLLLAVFGMTSATPERLTLTAMLLATATLLFAYVRRRMGPWPALIAAVLMLFVGPAWQVLLWPFQIGYVGAVLFGIAMLLALDRGDRRGDVAACAFLAIAIGFSSLGVAFAAGAAVDVLQRRRSHGLRRIWVAAIPLLLYGAWYIGWGHTAETHVTLRNVLESPFFLLEGLAASLAALLGFYALAEDVAARPEWGPPLLIAVVALLAYWQIRRPTFSARLLPVAATTASLWLLAGFNYIPGREAYTSRYLYAGAALVLLLLADLLSRANPRRPALIVAGAVALVAVASNLVALRDGQRLLEEQTTIARSNLAAIEIAGHTVDPAFTLTPQIAGTPSMIDIRAEQYLEAVRDHGSPAYDLAELESAPELGRLQADIVLGQALPIAIETAADSRLPQPRASVCAQVPTGDEVRVHQGVTRIDIPPGGPAELSLRRFATADHPVKTEGAPGDSTTWLEIPADAIGQPWFLRVDAGQGAAVCRQ